MSRSLSTKKDNAFGVRSLYQIIQMDISSCGFLKELKIYKPWIETNQNWHWVESSPIHREIQPNFSLSIYSYIQAHLIAIASSSCSSSSTNLEWPFSSPHFLQYYEHVFTVTLHHNVCIKITDWQKGINPWKLWLVTSTRPERDQVSQPSRMDKGGATRSHP